MNKISVCFLMLMSIFFVSCEFWGGLSARKVSGDAETDGDVSIVELAGGVKLLNNNTGGGLNGSGRLVGDLKPVGGNLAGDNNPGDGVVGDQAGGNEVMPKPLNTKLTEEDMKKLKDFTGNTKAYPRDLSYTISNAYSVPYAKIGTYSNCSDYSPGCFTQGPSDERKEGLKKLVEIKLEEKFKKLENMLKDISGYDPKALTNAIAKYERVLKEAQDANGKIKINNANAQERSKNIGYLKKVRDTLDAALDVMKQASLAYADAFTSVVSGMSSSQFKEAVNEFNRAAKEYAKVAPGTRFTVITEVIFSMASGRGLAYEKSFAKFGPGGPEFFAAIEKLESAYEAVKPEQAAKVKKK
ncbi:hypothetical protein [Borrelia sp. P9F1]|uniref:hypothetical protein n=1 Tax=Borrelia sp. P9F1 TaxID=3058374 RepID=UPI0026491FE5|nr:hypothetical protein [Borrelia sp. P9F1]WKC58726.1 hypothetical protein QYZ68_05845 [Borrelia sp. P9F1]